jgi:alpha-tubulin suppressor-like RCC1 family protein
MKKALLTLLYFALLVLLTLALSGCGSPTGSSSAAGLPLMDSISAGGGHTCGLDVTGGVWCWGEDMPGVTASPARVADLSLGVRGLATGPRHNCALTATGALRCWGANQVGQLGNGGTTDSQVPVDASQVGGITRAVSAGLDQTCVLNAVGGVVCWGASGGPAEVSGLGSGMKAISSGWHHTCALTMAGGVKCWGSNQYGQLGNGSTVDSQDPVDVSGLGFGVQMISAGAGHTCAITAVGAVLCWGRNQSGELGDGSTNDSAIPVQVSGLGAGARAVSAGGDDSAGHSCALTVSGAVVCWGSNSAGQLGDGTTTNSAVPVQVQGQTVGLRSVAAGGRHSCALTATGGTVCWGQPGGAVPAEVK